MENDKESVPTPVPAGQPLGEHGLTPEDQDFRATRDDVEVHPSV